MFQGNQQVGGEERVGDNTTQRKAGDIQQMQPLGAVGATWLHDSHIWDVRGHMTGCVHHILFHS